MLLIVSQDRQLDRILIDAVSAFRTVPRQTRDEIDRLDALALPLIEHASDTARKLVAAALAEVSVLPPLLSEALCMDLVPIAEALICSDAPLGDEMLIRVIEQKGGDHARLVAKRPGLSQAARDHLARYMRDNDLELLQAPSAPPVGAATGEDQVEALRSGLRGLMAGARIGAAAAAEAEDDTDIGTGTVVSELLNAAFRDDRAAMATLVARELDIAYGIAERAFNRVDYRAALTLLKAIGLGMTDCFAILALAYPAIVQRRETMALFYLRHEKISESDIASVLGQTQDQNNVSHPQARLSA